MHVTQCYRWVLDGSSCIRLWCSWCFTAAPVYDRHLSFSWGQVNKRSIIIYFPAPWFLCTSVSFCMVVNLSSRHRMNPRGVLPLGVSDESPGRWQGVITERKHWDIRKENLEGIKKIDVPSAGTHVKTCQWLYHLWVVLSVLLSSPSISISPKFHSHLVCLFTFSLLSSPLVSALINPI